MTISSALAIYFVVWWVVLFAVLPFGVRSQAEENEGGVQGTDPGAPVVAGMGKKLIWTTIISAVAFGIGWTAFRTGFVNLEQLYRLMGFPT